MDYFIGAIIGALIAAVGVYFIPKFGIKEAQKKSEAASKRAIELIKEAEEKAEHIVRSAQTDAKLMTSEMKSEAEREIKERKQEVSHQENKLLVREQNIDKRDGILQSKEALLDQKHDVVTKKIEDLEHKENELNGKINSIDAQIERIAMMTPAEARNIIMEKVESKMENEIAAYIRNQEEEARLKVNENAKLLLSTAIQKYSQEVATERTVSVVSLPSDELKGRIIGREGRNIRALEQKIGVDLIIDDTPEVITVSCFDPIRREIARLSLEYLIKDGRIQPGRIEEVVDKATADVNESTRLAGEEAMFKLGITKINKELVNYIGKLKYRTSYGQNVLQHSLEVAYLAGLMAAELGVDQFLARRAGLLHDLGKAADFEVEGSHVEIGARLAKKYGENPIVINAIESHHDDVPANHVISYLVAAADTLSAARPGARSENLENYIRRIEQLENICKEFDGVSNAFAIQAGREIRVMVMPDKIDDLKSFKIAHDIREKIENDMTYPGQIKVVVIRETRATEIAK